jgi:hypothetical protein
MIKHTHGAAFTLLPKIGLPLACVFALAAFVLTACPTDAEPTEEEKAASELAENAVLAGKVSVSGTTVTLTSNVSLESVTVPAGVTLATDSYTLTVPANKKLTVAGTLTVADSSKLTLSGTLEVEPNGAVTVDGKAFVGGSSADFTVGSSAKISIGVSSSVTTYTVSGGIVTINTGKQGKLDETRKVVVSSGAELKVNGELDVSSVEETAFISGAGLVSIPSGGTLKVTYDKDKGQLASFIDDQVRIKLAAGAVVVVRQGGYAMAENISATITFTLDSPLNLGAPYAKADWHGYGSDGSAAGGKLEFSYVGSVSTVNGMAAQLVGEGAGKAALTAGDTSKTTLEESLSNWTMTPNEGLTTITKDYAHLFYGVWHLTADRRDQTGNEGAVFAIGIKGGVNGYTFSGDGYTTPAQVAAADTTATDD